MMLIMLRRNPRPRKLNRRITVVVFTVPARRLVEMDVALGPCVVIPGRKKPLVSPLLQDRGETPALTAALYTALGGDPSDARLIEVARAGRGALSRFEDSFVDAMAEHSIESLRLADLDDARGERDLPSFIAHQDALDRAWMNVGRWPHEVSSTTNRLLRTANARVAREKGQSLYCWHGPAVPMRGIVAGRGPYPGRTPS